MHRRLLTLAVWFLTSAATFAADNKTKILLIGKDLDHPRNTHTYISDCELLAKCLRQTGAPISLTAKDMELPPEPRKKN